MVPPSSDTGRPAPHRPRGTHSGPPPTQRRDHPQLKAKARPRAPATKTRHRPTTRLVGPARGGARFGPGRRMPHADWARGQAQPVGLRSWSRCWPWPPGGAGLCAAHHPFVLVAVIAMPAERGAEPGAAPHPTTPVTAVAMRGPGSVRPVGLSSWSRWSPMSAGRVAWLDAAVTPVPWSRSTPCPAECGAGMTAADRCPLRSGRGVLGDLGTATPGIVSNPPRPSRRGEMSPLRAIEMRPVGAKAISALPCGGNRRYLPGKRAAPWSITNAHMAATAPRNEARRAAPGSAPRPPGMATTATRTKAQRATPSPTPRPPGMATTATTTKAHPAQSPSRKATLAEE